MDLDPDKMATVAGALPTVSAKIRALDAAGYARADIARASSGKRYQHVRNVLQRTTPSGGRSGYVVGSADLGGAVARGQPTVLRGPGDDAAYIQSRAHGVYRLVVRADGSILLPKDVAERLNARPASCCVAPSASTATSSTSSALKRRWRR